MTRPNRLLEISLWLLLFVLRRPLVSFLSQRRQAMQEALDLMLLENCALDEISDYAWDWRYTSYRAEESQLRGRVRFIDQLLDALGWDESDPPFPWARRV